MNLLRHWFLKIKWHGWQKLNRQELIHYIAQKILDVSETVYLDAKFFVEACEKSGVNITNEMIDNFVELRQKGMPVSKIINARGFWALDFYVTEDVLDPRPDSETLIEAVLEYFSDKNQYLNILDIGTGSGCLLISLLYEYKNAKGTGVDISAKALAVARQNAKGYPAEFFEKDFYSDDFKEGLRTYDVIISNPPYIKTADIEQLDKAVRFYDPLCALDGGFDGLDAYRCLAKEIKPLLKENGLVFFEIGKDQKDDVVSIMEKNGFSFLKSYKDLGKIERVLVFKVN